MISYAQSNCRAVQAGLAELTETQQQLLLLLVADPPVPYCEISRRMKRPDRKHRADQGSPTEETTKDRRRAAAHRGPAQ